MKPFPILILCLLILTCGPKVKTSIDSNRQPLANNAIVVVLGVNDIQSISETEIGELKIQDGGLASECSYYENISAFKILARKAGANLIKITKHKQPDNWSTCHRIWAKIYKVENPKIYETKIRWSENRKLTWDDFKGKPDLENYPNTLAVTNSGFGFEPSAFNLFKKGELFIEAVMNTNDSWVLLDSKSDYVLRHEQIHFDITEIFSRKLRKIFSENNFSSKDYVRAKEVFEATFAESKSFQERYDLDTQQGEKVETQEKWEAIVEIELLKYEAYKN